MSTYFDRRTIDDYIFTALVQEGYAPILKEVHTITDIFVNLLLDAGFAREEEMTIEELEQLTMDFEEDEE